MAYVDRYGRRLGLGFTWPWEETPETVPGSAQAFTPEGGEVVPEYQASTDDPHGCNQVVCPSGIATWDERINQCVCPTEWKTFEACNKFGMLFSYRNQGCVTKCPGGYVYEGEMSPSVQQAIAAALGFGTGFLGTAGKVLAPLVGGVAASFIADRSRCSDFPGEPGFTAPMGPPSKQPSGSGGGGGTITLATTVIEEKKPSGVVTLPTVEIEGTLPKAVAARTKKPGGTATTEAQAGKAGPEEEGEKIAGIPVPVVYGGLALLGGIALFSLVSNLSESE